MTVIFYFLFQFLKISRYLSTNQNNFASKKKSVFAIINKINENQNYFCCNGINLDLE